MPEAATLGKGIQQLVHNFSQKLVGEAPKPEAPESAASEPVAPQPFQPPSTIRSYAEAFRGPSIKPSTPANRPATPRGLPTAPTGSFQITPGGSPNTTRLSPSSHQLKTRQPGPGCSLTSDNSPIFQTTGPPSTEAAPFLSWAEHRQLSLKLTPNTPTRDPNMIDLAWANSALCAMGVMSVVPYDLPPLAGGQRDPPGLSPPSGGAP